MHRFVSQLSLPRFISARLAIAVLALILTACTGLPKGVQPIDDFELDRYLGTWYEIARLDHRFERGLSRVTANYSLRDDGGVTVLNRGFAEASGEFKEASGKARFVSSATTGHLKVSFFGPFYGSYVIFYLDPDYRYAFVSGYNKRNLWLLSRTPVVDDAVVTQFRSESERLGFDVSELIMVDQSPVE
jgi:apolipoprotein D and lipocalin family protein